MLPSLEPRDVTVFVTSQCNSNCIMCPCSDYERRRETAMDDGEMLEYIQNLPEDTEYVVVTGGEPTLRKERFFQIMAALADRLPETETLLLTNGRSFASKEMVRRLLAYCPPYLTAAIPIHGSTPAMHDGITRAEGSLRQTLAGVRNLLAGGVTVEIRVVVIQQNRADIPNIAALIARELPGVSVVNFIGLEMMGNCAKNRDTVYLSCEESFQCSRDGIDLLLEQGVDVGLYNYPLCSVDKGYWPLCKKSITPGKVRFQPECDTCRAKPYCGGFFVSTLAAAKPRAVPVL